MKISIVTISYNQVDYLNRCLSSVTEQELPLGVELEYIVVDAGSSDGSREIISKYESTIKVFEPDSGPADGLSKGLSRATGDVLGFINADDYLLPGALKRISKEFYNSNVDVVSGCGYIERESGERTLVKPTKFKEKLLKYRAGIIFQQGTFFTRSAYESSGGINRKNKTSWDFELFYNFSKLRLKHRLLLTDPVAVFYVHDESISGSQRFNDLNTEEIDSIASVFYKGFKYRYMSAFLKLVRRVV